MVPYMVGVWLDALVAVVAVESRVESSRLCSVCGGHSSVNNVHQPKIYTVGGGGACCTIFRPCLGFGGGVRVPTFSV